MNNIFIGILLGIAAGILDVIPMTAQKLPWDAKISAFCLWVVVGFMVATSSLQMPGVLKGLLISFLVLLPVLIIIAWKDSKSIPPIIIMTTVLGTLLGFFIDKLTK